MGDGGVAGRRHGRAAADLLRFTARVQYDLFGHAARLATAGNKSGRIVFIAERPAIGTMAEAVIALLRQIGPKLVELE